MLKTIRPDQEKITLFDIFVLTQDKAIKWIRVEASGVYPTQTFRCLYKNRIYILFGNRLDVFNSRNDNLIWFEKSVSKLVNLIKEKG